MHRKTPIGVAGLQFYQKETPAQAFFCEYCGIFKNTYFEKYLRKISQLLNYWSLLIAVKFSAVTKIILFILGNYNRAGICISRPPALCLAPDPGPKCVFTGPAPEFVFTGPGPQFGFTSSDPQFGFTPNLHLPVQPGLSLHIPTLSPLFVFTGPGLWSVCTQAAKLIYLQWCWTM